MDAHYHSAHLGGNIRRERPAACEEKQRPGAAGRKCGNRCYVLNNGHRESDVVRLLEKIEEMLEETMDNTTNWTKKSVKD